jgi:hypothetical protein
MDGFVRGLHALLWIEVIVIPHLLLLPLLAWHWGSAHGALFISYSVVVASAYLGLELRLIGVIPFSKQLDPARGSLMLPALIATGTGMAVAVALQHLLIFRSPAIVTATIVTGAIAAFFLTRGSLRALALSVRFYLGIDSAEHGTIYTEVA